MTDTDTKPRTPWQKVFARLGLTQAELAKAMGYNRSAISRAINGEGMISGRNQAKLIKIGRKLGREITPMDLIPHVERD